MPTIIVEATKPSPTIFKDAAIYQKERKWLCWESLSREMRDWRDEIFFNLFGKTDNKILYFNFALATVIPIFNGKYQNHQEGTG